MHLVRSAIRVPLNQDAGELASSDGAISEFNPFSTAIRINTFAMPMELHYPITTAIDRLTGKVYFPEKSVLKSFVTGIVRVPPIASIAIACAEWSQRLGTLLSL